MDTLRDYGDNQTLVLHLGPDHPRIGELKRRAQWYHLYYDTTGKKPRVVGYDLAFQYNADRASLRRELQRISKRKSKKLLRY